MLIEVPEKVAKKIVVKRDGKRLSLMVQKLHLLFKKDLETL